MALKVPSHSLLDDCRLMIVEPYDFGFPFRMSTSKNDAMKESNYVSNTEDSRKGGAIHFVSIEREARAALDLD